MLRRFTAIVASVALTATSSLAITGCMGRMALTGKVTEANLNFNPNKWPRQILFLILNIIPVYPLASLADLLIFNAIEFWTGENPISKEKALVLTARMEAPDGSSVVQTGNPDGSIDIDVYQPDGTHHRLTLTREDGRVVARDAEGTWLGEVDATGNVWVARDSKRVLASLALPDRG